MKTQECYQLLREVLETGEPAVTATVVRAKGSTPREPGAKMLIRANGTVQGTIGGGCGESDVLTTARQMLEHGVSERRLVRVDLTEEILESSDRICGGIMDVAVECWTEPVRDLERLGSYADEPAVRVIPISETKGQGVEVFSDTRVSPQSPIEGHVDQTLRDKRSHATNIESIEHQGEGALFFEYAAGLHTLLICGAGHIAQPLSQIGKMLDYRVIVIDDRPKFASGERFPDADDVIAKPFQQALRELPITSDTVAVMVTRGHRYDEFCLRELLSSKASYLGLLGSRRRVRAVFHDLLEDGYPREQLERIFAPVGIDIGAQTPSEIAISIMGELVALKRGRIGGHMRIPVPSPRRRRIQSA